MFPCWIKKEFLSSRKDLMFRKKNEQKFVYNLLQGFKVSTFLFSVEKYDELLSALVTWNVKKNTLKVLLKCLLPSTNELDWSKFSNFFKKKLFSSINFSYFHIIPTSLAHLTLLIPTIFFVFEHVNWSELWT
jgi:hypothetical protein